MTDDDLARREVEKRESMARLLCLVMALIGVVVTAVPIALQMEPYYVPLILVGSGVAVVSLAIFLYFSI